jgi:phosphoribosylformylglycinamidine synthase
MASGAVIAIQDMGAAGLTCSAVEMGAKGDLGLELDLDAVPCREPGMSAYEMMLSESQERMLMVLKPEMEATARAIFEKWDLDFAIVGRTTDNLRFVVKHQGEVMADLPIKELGDEAPEYDRPHTASEKPAPLDPASVPAPPDLGAALLKLMSAPDLASRRWVWEQYDHLILGNTLQRPGGDAAVIALDGILGPTPKGLALTTDVTPRYVAADPVEGGKQAVAEAYRNLSAVGAKGLAITDNLNFGNPEKPAIMGELVGAIRGIGEASRALDLPIVSGNVSLYNETQGIGILPTPTIGAVGLLEVVRKHMTLAFKSPGEVLVLLGETRGHLGQSLYLREILGREEGAPPPVDLAAEARCGTLVRNLIQTGQVTAVHDLSDGGLLIALAEMALASGIGATLEPLPQSLPAHAYLFGEDQGRYLLAVSSDRTDVVLQHAREAGVPAHRIGVTGGSEIQLAGAAVALAALRKAHEGWFPSYMDE